MNNNLSLISEALGEVQSAIDLVTSIDNAFTYDHAIESHEQLGDVIQATLDDVKLAHDALENLHTLIQARLDDVTAYRESCNLKHNC